MVEVGAIGALEGASQLSIPLIIDYWYYFTGAVTFRVIMLGRIHYWYLSCVWCPVKIAVCEKFSA